MKRRLNYTGRKKIEKERIKVDFIYKGQNISSCKIIKLDLDELNLPRDSKLFFEAYFRTELKRFDLGTVNNLKIHNEINLSNLAFKNYLKFRLLVVDQNGKILALADKISPNKKSDIKPLLPVQFEDLGNLIWKVDYTDIDGPTLLINNKINGIEYYVKNDPKFFLNVFPAVLKEILTYIIFIDKYQVSNDNNEDWQNQWIQFANELESYQDIVLNSEDLNFDPEDVFEWIENVTASFADKYYYKFEKYCDNIGYD